MSNLQVVLLEPARVVLAQMGQFVLNVLKVAGILIVGWLLSRLIKTVITKGLRTLKLDDFSDRIELDSVLAKGGIKYSLSELIGVIIYWTAILITFAIAMNAVNLNVAAEIISKIVGYVPNVIVAIFILIAGMFAAILLKNIVQSAASNAGISQVNLLGKIVETIVIVITILIALGQLNVAQDRINLIITIALGSIGLGLALAIGLGCKDIVGKAVEDFIEKLKTKK